MSLTICALNSGSNGNCFYIGNEQDAILVDAGLSCKETEIRMQRLSLALNKVRAIFISHEHLDHIRGLAILAKKYQLPVYITTNTLNRLKKQLPPHLVQSFIAYHPIKIGDLIITAFPKFHDAIDPHSFTIANSATTVGVFTDIGSHCEHVISNFKKCNAVFLETNYDDEMLANGTYPYYLKSRISGNYGHLSNQQALDLFLNYRTPKLSHVFLSHLSKDNNCENKVHQLFAAHAENTEIILASRHVETALYHIEN